MKLKIKYYLFSNLLMICLSLLFSGIFTILIIKNVINSDIGYILCKIIGAIIFICGGIYLGRKIKNKGYLIGIISILVYLFIILCLSLTNVSISSVDVVIRCICLFSGSIIGVNTFKN